MNGITVVIPSVPSRNLLVGRAVSSVSAQTQVPDAVIVAYDDIRGGAAYSRTKGLNMVQTEWTAFLDDDDEMGTEHLEKLYAHAIATQADFVFPWFTVMGGPDPFPANEKIPWTLEAPHQTTVTFLVRTEAAKAVGGFLDPQSDPECDPGTDSQGNRAGEEFRFVVRLAEAGYKIEKLYERTWTWHHWTNGPRPGNSSGLPSGIDW